MVYCIFIDMQTAANGLNPARGARPFEKTAPCEHGPELHFPKECCSEDSAYRMLGRTQGTGKLDPNGAAQRSNPFLVEKTARAEKDAAGSGCAGRVLAQVRQDDRDARRARVVEQGRRWI